MTTPFSAINIGVCAIAVHDAFLPAADIVRAVWPLVFAFAMVLTRNEGSGVARARCVREGALAIQDVLEMHTHEKKEKKGMSALMHCEDVCVRTYENTGTSSHTQHG